ECATLDDGDLECCQPLPCLFTGRTAVPAAAAALAGTCNNHCRPHHLRNAADQPSEMVRVQSPRQRSGRNYLRDLARPRRSVVVDQRGVRGIRRLLGAAGGRRAGPEEVAERITPVFPWHPFYRRAGTTRLVSATPHPAPSAPQMVTGCSFPGVSRVAVHRLSGGQENYFHRRWRSQSLPHRPEKPDP